MSILVTGGTGYIGSHSVVELTKAGYDVVILDNLSNSSKVVLDRLEQIIGKKPKFYQVDVRNADELNKIFDENNIEGVIHFAGYKAVGESCEKPLMYYENNIGGTVCLVSTMLKHGCNKLIFSSSATVYGDPSKVPIDENQPKGIITNPYGRTKSIIEDILTDVSKANPDFCVTLLRYFNPIGASDTGLIGEDPRGIPNNLVPYIAQVAVGRREYLSVWGNDYDTPDGTGVRDYIHVVDLAIGHVKAFDKIKKGVQIYNLGTGRGYSVLEVVAAFSQACGKEIPYKICDRRPGDIATCYSDPAKAFKELGFKAQYSIEDMCESAWKFQSQNPNGYE